MGHWPASNERSIELNDALCFRIDFSLAVKAITFGLMEQMPVGPTGESLAESKSRLSLGTATVHDREEIYLVRHLVYAAELGQHPINGTGSLRDAVDDWNVYLVAKTVGKMTGFISITPPGHPSYSIDKYLQRDSLPFPIDDHLYEVRLLTVVKAHRGDGLAFLLMYAALRWVEAHGGKHIVAMGRHEIVEFYLRVGLQPAGRAICSGRLSYDLLHAEVAAFREKLAGFSDVLTRFQEKTDWRLPFAFRKPAPCFHGGTFFQAVGDKFQTLEKHQTIINADVLDAWFPPSPRVLGALAEHLPWLLRTSPPASCAGLIETIAQARGVQPHHILPGNGSSDLLFRALRYWLKPSSRALILDPTYGEYAHVLEQVIGCTVQRLVLSRAEGYEVELSQLEKLLADEYDLLVLVNPNSPTGRHIHAGALRQLLARAPLQTRIWVDETYIEYAGAGESLEGFAAQSENVLVCKSMSKVYALSGARAAYLCGPAHQLEELRSVTPPWVVSLPAQVAAVKALEDPGYYQARYQETSSLREELTRHLESLGWEVVPGVANFLLCHLPPSGPSAASLVQQCAADGLFLRDAGTMGSQLGTHALRVAVKDRSMNKRMLQIIRRALATAVNPRDKLLAQPAESCGYSFAGRNRF